MKDVKFLDCTLRDGAHVVSGDFEYSRILNVINKLTASDVDIIEFGFLKMCEYDPDKIYFPHIEDAYAILDETDTIVDSDNSKKPIYALMARADEYNIKELTNFIGRIKLIRVAFYYDFLDGGIEFAKKAMEQGYMVSLNLINTLGASMDELKVFIDRANEIEPFAVSIVDTFGVLEFKELISIVSMYDSQLNLKTRIGLHTHENLSLAFALAQTFLDIPRDERKVIIDGSLMGIGRAPGNLCTELAVNYLNDKYGKSIRVNQIMKAINDDIKPLKRKYKWGYAPEFVLSAKYRVHRSYAEYLEGQGVDLSDIDGLLSSIDPSKKEKYNQTYIIDLAKRRGLL